MQFIKLTNIQINNIWPEMAEILAACFKRRAQVHTIVDIKNGIDKGEYQLWGAITNEGILLGGVVTSVDEASAGRKMTILELAGSKFKLWAKLMENELERFAGINNCGTIEAWTRRGFSKVLPAFEVQKDVLLIKRVG